MAGELRWAGSLVAYVSINIRKEKEKDSPTGKGEHRHGRRRARRGRCGGQPGGKSEI